VSLDAGYGKGWGMVEEEEARVGMFGRDQIRIMQSEQTERVRGE